MNDEGTQKELLLVLSNTALGRKKKKIRKTLAELSLHTGTQKT